MKEKAAKVEKKKAAAAPALGLKEAVANYMAAREPLLRLDLAEAFVSKTAFFKTRDGRRCAAELLPVKKRHALTEESCFLCVPRRRTTFANELC